MEKKQYRSLWNFILTLFPKYLEHRIGKQKSRISDYKYVQNLEISMYKSINFAFVLVHGGNALEIREGMRLCSHPPASKGQRDIPEKRSMCYFMLKLSRTFVKTEKHFMITLKYFARLHKYFLLKIAAF